MPRPPDPAVRQRLVDVAADLLATGDDVTLRRVAAEAGTSTMAVYTYFDGMPGLWRAVRDRAFTRLASRLEDVAATEDPVADLVALGRAFVDTALSRPALYTAMFDLRREAAQPASAAVTFAVLVAGVERAVAAGRLAGRTDPVAAATRLWGATHGFLALVLVGALPPSALDDHLPPTYAALLVAWGDGPRRAPRSVAAGWAVRTPSPAEPG
ncbi:TetR/AcrR family transcriptional regulator [Iamia majanohamensis]|uniref:TetR/AcrR family transcriptional regulator n=1 Tax=Iamia majanohamensis TaxID=467976 RepID=A0AAF0BRL9_9ACTN|nr:TetR/AcrR family transcriptional regulator [Iamia majanohamensis]WCO66921.1 TetR/AcrR family transcriptional regulator [Iamia majanohamensis]